jgi:hypothetical protein
MAETKKDKNVKNIIRSPWHLWNSPETTSTSSHKGASKKKIWFIFKNV